MFQLPVNVLDGDSEPSTWFEVSQNDLCCPPWPRSDLTLFRREWNTCERVEFELPSFQHGEAESTATEQCTTEVVNLEREVRLLTEFPDA